MRRNKVIKYVLHNFVSDYDIPFRYDDAIGVLWKTGCYQDLIDSPDKRSLLYYVGAHFCAMIREDVNLRLAEGLQLMRRSLGAAHELEIQKRSWPNQALARYVLARWHDARGRLFFRCGNYSVANLAFQRALSFTESNEAHYTDIKSNEIRNRFDLAQQAGAGDAVVERCRLELRCLADSCQKSLITTKQKRRDRRERERGEINCLHNWLLCRTKNKQPDASHEAEVRKRLDSFRKKGRDLYRLWQLDNADAFLQKGDAEAIERDAGCVTTASKAKREKAVELYKGLANCKWPRGRFFAEQNLADMNDDFSALLNICDQIAADQKQNRDLDSTDIDRYHYTLLYAERLARNGLPNNAIAKQEQIRLANHQHAITVALVSVVSIASYLPRFEKFLRPRMRSLVFQQFERWVAKRSVNDKFARDVYDDTIDALERFAARDVVEILRSNCRRRDAGPANVSGFVIKQSELPLPSGVAAPTAGHNVPVLPLASPIEPNYASSLSLKIAEARAAEEEHWIANPLVIQATKSNVSDRARQLTRGEPGLLIIRFAQFLKGSTTELVAFWWFCGTEGAVYSEFDRAKVDALVRNLANPEMKGECHIVIGSGKDRKESLEAPNPKMAKELWSEVIEPVIRSARSRSNQKIGRILFGLEGGLFHLPLHSACLSRVCIERNFLSTNEKGELPDVDFIPLGMVCPIAFTMNLTSSLVDGRYELNNCSKEVSDDLSVFAIEDDKVFQPYLAPLQVEADKWKVSNPRSAFYGEGSCQILEFALKNRPEFIVFACHGVGDKTSGTRLPLTDGYIISQNLSFSSAFVGNKLTVVCACESGAAGVDSYGQLIGSFIAAGSGAMLANQCRALIPVVCTIGAVLLENSRTAGQMGCFLDVELMLASRSALTLVGPYLRGVEAAIMATSYQLWL